tara:strand:- start:76159 stop:76269 length:111 start_codon:yes stop_codon:yes gene_type:complete
VTQKLINELAALFAIFFSIYLGAVLAWHIYAYFYSA